MEYTNVMKPVLVSQDAANKMVEFFKTLPEMNVVPCDEPFEAFTGFLAFHKELCDTEVWFGWQHSKPVRIQDRQPILDEIFDPAPACDGAVSLKGEAETLIRRCITETGWVPLDDPKRRMLGFVKYAPFGSNEETECHLISLLGLKRMDEGLRKEVLAWRDRCRKPQEALK